MKLVEDTAHFGGAQQNFLHPATSNSDLKARVAAAEFSGPPHLASLRGRCFSHTEGVYRYEFCPFHNVTQHEETARWDPYHGVLGVWREWKIQNYRFTAMMMPDGDACGADKFRSVQVVPVCGATYEVRNVTEPATCQYVMTFAAPLMCHNHSLLVYPVLSEAHQREWDALESRWHNDELTEKGYHRLLRRLFESAGLQKNADTKSETSAHQLDKEKGTAVEYTVDETGKIDPLSFSSLATCQSEYNELKKEVETLKILSEVHQSKCNACCAATVEAHPFDGL